jgi:hypothetical protein
MSGELLPPAKELAKLTDDQAKSVIFAVDRANAREHSYAIAALLCGTLCFLGVVAGFVYLVVNGHVEGASLLLGVAVLAIIGQMIRSRLRP